jgi:hypothetical protein
MKIEDLLAETLKRAGADEPVVVDAWARFERRARRSQRRRLIASAFAAAGVIGVLLVAVPRIGANREGLIQGIDTSRWKTYVNEREGYRFKHPADWGVHSFEGSTEVGPAELPGLSQGEATFALQFRVVPRTYVEPYFCSEPELPCPSFPPGVIPEGPGPLAPNGSLDGRSYVRQELTEAGSHEIQYRIDWTVKCSLPPEAPGLPTIKGCVPPPQTLLVRVLGGSERLWDLYRATGETIVQTLELYVDPTAGWKVFVSSIESRNHYRLKHPVDWAESGFEGTDEFRPPGLGSLAKGEPTFAVAIRLLAEPFESPVSCERSTCPTPVPEARGTIGGAPYVRTELRNGEYHEVRYRIEWGRCPNPRPIDAWCPGDLMTLEARVIAGTSSLWDRYRETAELIVLTIRPTPLPVCQGGPNRSPDVEPTTEPNGDDCYSVGVASTGLSEPALQGTGP